MFFPLLQIFHNHRDQPVRRCGYHHFSTYAQQEEAKKKQRANLSFISRFLGANKNFGTNKLEKDLKRA